MTETSLQSFPKSARLLKSADFRFARHRKFDTDYFQFVYTNQGRGRLGISASKRAIKLSVGRNRIKRLLRETYRKQKEAFSSMDIHVVLKPMLREIWPDIGLELVENDFKLFRFSLGR